MIAHTLQNHQPLQKRELKARQDISGTVQTLSELTFPATEPNCRVSAPWFRDGHLSSSGRRIEANTYATRLSPWC
jgi:hypothetical protein